MYLRVIGKQVQLLQGYRDGAGRVRQRCLGRFRNESDGELQWNRLEATLSSTKGELHGLKSRFLELLKKLPPSCNSRETKVVRHSKALLHLLSEGDIDSFVLYQLRQRLVTHEFPRSATLASYCTISDHTEVKGPRSTRSATPPKSSPILPPSTPQQSATSPSALPPSTPQQSATSPSALPPSTPQQSATSPSALPPSTLQQSTGVTPSDLQASTPSECSATLLEEVLKTRCHLSPRRLRFHANEFGVEAHVRSLDALASQQSKTQQEQDLLQTLKLRAQVKPDLASLTDYSLALSEVGRPNESILVLDELPRSDAWANLNRAAICYRQGRIIEASDSLFRGLAGEPHFLQAFTQICKNRRPLQGEEYWLNYGHLWNEAGRALLLRLWKLPLVRIRLTEILRGARPRSLFGPHVQGRMVARPGLWLPALSSGDPA